MRQILTLAFALFAFAGMAQVPDTFRVYLEPSEPYYFEKIFVISPGNVYTVQSEGRAEDAFFPVINGEYIEAQDRADLYTALAAAWQNYADTVKWNLDGIYNMSGERDNYGSYTLETNNPDFSSGSPYTVTWTKDGLTFEGALYEIWIEEYAFLKSTNWPTGTTLRLEYVSEYTWEGEDGLSNTWTLTKL